MVSFAFLPLLVLFQVFMVRAGEDCPYNYYIFNTPQRYCEYGCCGDKYSSYSDVCCVNHINALPDCKTVNVGVIVGIVIGCLVGLAILITIIVCCCRAACTSGRTTGTVIQPPQNMFVMSTQVQSTNPGVQTPVGYGYSAGVSPPAYSPYTGVPPGGNISAYPPQPATKY